MRVLSRRQFARLVLGGVGLSALGGCAADAPPAGPVTEVATLVPAPTPATLATATATATFSPKMLSNDNVPGFFVRYYQEFEAPNPEDWTLSVDGLVQTPLDLSLADVLGLDRAAQTSRMKCVECWSAAAEWEGFHLSTLMSQVNPHPSATWLHIFCVDHYFESMSIDALLGDRVLFAHHMNGVPLPDIYGAPLRLMVPFRYGYKSAKVIRHLQFAEREIPGYWPTFGSYSTSGNIAAGGDRPLDLEGTRRIEGGAEIFYPDGIESSKQ